MSKARYIFHKKHSNSDFVQSSIGPKLHKADEKYSWLDVWRCKCFSIVNFRNSVAVLIFLLQCILWQNKTKTNNSPQNNENQPTKINKKASKQTKPPKSQTNQPTKRHIVNAQKSFIFYCATRII